MDRAFDFRLKELSGALGDLGTLLPITLGAIAVGGLAPAPVLAGFAVFYIATALVYRLPVPVQPMKAIAAVLLVGAATPGAVAAAGVLVGVVLVVLGASGAIDRLGRLVPQSVLAGLQLGLGLALASVAFRLLSGAPAIGLLALGLLVGLMATRRLPAALIFLFAAVLAGQVFGLPGAPSLPAPGQGLPGWPTFPEMRLAVTHLALPQLSLTITNAVLLTALVMRDFHGDRARQVTPRKLCLTSGLANLVLAPLGALPMCHGAGGAAAHARFGARTGGAPLMLGAGFLALATLPRDFSHTALALIPLAALGSLLMVAAWDLAISRRLFDGKPSCRPVIAVTALGTVALDPFLGLVLGTAAEALRVLVLRRLAGSPGRP